MNLLVIVVLATTCFVAAYWGYGRLLTWLLKLDPKAKTPAVELRDDVDYVPIAPQFLITQHFSAIAAAGPIVGPILAGVYFGWLPALLWIVIGCIFIGGVHDFTALVASVRHKARSIAEVVREHMSRRSYVLFLVFVWIALVYIIVAFTDIVASSFVGLRTLEDSTQIHGGATATSSLLYLALPVVMGLLLRYTKLSVGWATVIFLPLVGVAIWAGPLFPLDLAGLLGINDAAAVKVWDVLLLVYCLVAAAVPMWLLLQPRGHLGGYFLFVAVGGALLGIVIGGVRAWLTGDASVAAINYPAFMGWESVKGGALFPMLFITIACGACSGFHCLVASGTTSKQLRRETDALPVGYGAMLAEGLVAVVSLATVMMLSASAVKGKDPNLIYALGNGAFFSTFGVSAVFARSFALLAFTTFVYDTLDVCTRLGRYILQELTGWETKAGRWFAMALTAGVPLLFVMQKTTDATGNAVPTWRVFWSLFGASNQLMAALALVGVTVWLWRTYRQAWVWPVVGLPAIAMYTMSMWALGQFITDGFLAGKGLPVNPVPWAALVLVGLAVLVLIEAVRSFLKPSKPAPVIPGTIAPAVS
jgi:carbon starvation protein